MTRAVVLGGGLAGVLAATVLARHAGEVLLVESDRYPPDPVPRRGLPQSRHSHVLVTGGARALDRLLPGTLAELYARGAHRRGLPGDALVLAAQGWFRRLDTGAGLVSCGRGLLDQVVRERALPGVTVLTGTRALGLAGDRGRVTAAVVGNGDGRARTIGADLIVDATGRRSKAPRWLAAIGAAPIEEVTVSSGLAYSTRLFRAPAELAAGMPAVMLHPSAAPGRPGRGATLFPIEDGRWIVTLTGTRGGEPPADERGFTAFARALRAPIVADLMAAAIPLSGVRPYRDTANRRRFFERAALPAGFLAIGDAVCALNPVHSHGMSVAALSALRLDAELTRHGADPSAFPAAQAAVAAETDPSWRLALAQDSGHDSGQHGGQGGGHDSGRDGRREASAFEREILARRSRALLSSRELATGFFRAQALIPAPPADGAAVARALTGEPAPLLTMEEAIAQHPGLHAWWSASATPARAGGAPIHR